MSSAFQLANSSSFSRLYPTNNPASTTPITDFDRFAECLKSSQFTFETLESVKSSLKTLLQSDKMDIQRLHQFIENLISWSLSTKDPLLTLNFLSEVLTLEKLTELVREKAILQHISFTSLKECAELKKDLYSIENIESFKNGSTNQWKAFGWRLLHFFPNLINLIINSLSYLDCHKKFTSLWDRFSLLDIIYKFCLIPYALVQILTPFLITPTKVYMVAALVIGGIGIAVAAYKKWIMPIPHELLNCEKLDKKASMGLLNNVGEPAEMAALQSALLAKSIAFLVGDPGSGKTALMERFVQLKKERKLEDPLQRLHNFSFDCGALLGTNTYGYSELIYQTKTQIEGIEKDLIIFFDEMDQIANDRNAMEAIKTHFLSEGGPRVVAAMTPKGYASLIKMLGGSFGRRVQVIPVFSPADPLLKQVLWNYLQQEAADLPVDDNCIPRLIELIRKNPDFSPEIGEIGKAKKILKDVIGRTRYSFTANYTPPELTDLRNQYHAIRARISATCNYQSDDLKSFQNLKTRISKIEGELLAYRTAAKKIQNIVAMQHKLKQRYAQILQQITSSALPEPYENVKKLYLLYEFYAIRAFKTKLDHEIDSIRQSQNEVVKPPMHIKIDAASITKVFEESSNLELQQKR